MGRKGSLRLEYPRDKNLMAKLGVLEAYEKSRLRGSTLSIEPSPENRPETSRNVGFSNKKPKIGRSTGNNNKRRLVDGKSFASIFESECYLELKSLQDSGVISNLKCQQIFKFVHNGVKIWRSIVDFTFDKNGPQILEAKNPWNAKDRTFKTTVAMCKAFLNIDVIVVIQGETNMINLIKNL